MRLRITRQLDESMDGIQFSLFRPGYVYQVGTTIGNYLLAVDAADLVADDEPFIVLSPEKQLFLPTPSQAPSLPTNDSASRRNAQAIVADWAPNPAPRRLRLRRNGRRLDLEARVAALAIQLRKIKRHLEGAR